VSEEKFSKCEEGKKISVEFWVFGKKRIERKVPEKNQSVFFWKFEVKIFVAVKS
jgi:hypothetical protein